MGFHFFGLTVFQNNFVSPVITFATHLMWIYLHSTWYSLRLQYVRTYAYFLPGLGLFLFPLLMEEWNWKKDDNEIGLRCVCLCFFVNIFCVFKTAFFVKPNGNASNDHFCEDYH